MFRKLGVKPVNGTLMFWTASYRLSPDIRSSEPFMRATLTILAVATVLGGMSVAQAEKRIFIIPNNADGYGVDRCLASGAGCGNAVATAYCRSHEFATAISFRKVDRDEITGAVPTNAGTCRSLTCDEFVAIECAR